MVAGELQVFRGRCSGNSFRVELDDAIMALAQAELVLGADHAVAFNATDLALFDGDTVAIGHVQRASHCCHQHLLTIGNIGCAAHDSHGDPVAKVHRTNAQPIGVGMLLALQYMPDHHTGQHTLHRLQRLHAFHLQPGAREHVRSSLWC